MCTRSWVEFDARREGRGDAATILKAALAHPGTRGYSAHSQVI
jgi:hypothetical protein